MKNQVTWVWWLNCGEGQCPARLALSARRTRLAAPTLPAIDPLEPIAVSVDGLPEILDHFGPLAHRRTGDFLTAGDMDNDERFAALLHEDPPVA